MARGRLRVVGDERVEAERLVRIRALLAILEAERDGIDAEIGRLRQVCSVWELTMQGMEGRAVGGLREVERRVGVDLTGYDDPNRLREQPEDYGRDE